MPSKSQITILPESPGPVTFSLGKTIIDPVVLFVTLTVCSYLNKTQLLNGTLIVEPLLDK